MIWLDFGAFLLQRPSMVCVIVPLSFSPGEMSHNCLALSEIKAFESAHAKQIGRAHV